MRLRATAGVTVLAPEWRSPRPAAKPKIKILLDAAARRRYDAGAAGLGT